MNQLNVKNNEVAIYGVGGLGEIGKNTYGVQFQDEIILIDAGIKFPEEDLLGVDYVIPDYQYLIENKNKIKALVITHGHEDHIGGVPYLLKHLNVPVYAGPLALALIKNKLTESGQLKSAHLHQIEPDSKLSFGKMSVSFFRTTHSIPDTVGVAVHTPCGIVVETGDYKFDLTPVNRQPPDLQEMAHLGQEGVLCLMSDSTNAERPGWTKPEIWVRKSIEHIFNRARHGRIIFATFASNVSRIKTACDVAVEHHRKIAVFGRSMKTAIVIGEQLGYLNIPKQSVVSAEELHSIPANKTLILCTGSQGEQLAALSRIANGTHRQISIQPHDTVVFSSNPIPGNTVSVNKVINELEEDGAYVVHGRVNKVHTSGHGRQEEQELMLRLMKPKYFMPIHGEYRMLKIHVKMAQECGVPKQNCFIMQNGDVLALTQKSARIAGHFAAGDVYIDNNGIGDVGNAVLHDRQLMSEEGIVIAVATINSKTNQIEAGPDLLSRGFVYMRQSGQLLARGKQITLKAIQTSLNQSSVNEPQIKKIIISQLQKFLFKETKRRPLIMPMLIID